MIQFDYTDKVAFLTGAGSGIGKAAALEFARAGAKLVLSDMNEAAVAVTADEVRALGAEVISVICDVRHKGQVQTALSAGVEKFGRIDVAINNAGVEHAMLPISECDDEQWDLTLDVNLKGLFYCLKYELQHMMKQNAGIILNLASVAGISGAPLMGPYAASKHGVVGLTKTAAFENARYNIRVNAICPGVTGTEMVERFIEEQGGPEAVKKLTAVVPLRRIAKVEEIVDGILWLCSEQNSFMTGQCVAFDGGLLTV